MAIVKAWRRKVKVKFRQLCRVWYDQSMNSWKTALEKISGKKSVIKLWNLKCQVLNFWFLPQQWVSFPCWIVLQENIIILFSPKCFGWWALCSCLLSMVLLTEELLGKKLPDSYILMTLCGGFRFTTATRSWAVQSTLSLFTQIFIKY